MQATITQAIRPYLAHYGNAHEAAERTGEHGAELANDCAAMHARLAAKRARDALRATPVQPLCDPSWVGTVNMDAGFDPSQRRAARNALIATACRHREHMLGMPDTDDATWRRLWAVSSHYIEQLA